MDSIRVSEALDPRSIRGEATNVRFGQNLPMNLFDSGTNKPEQQHKTKSWKD